MYTHQPHVELKFVILKSHYISLPCNKAWLEFLDLKLLRRRADDVSTLPSEGTKGYDFIGPEIRPQGQGSVISGRCIFQGTHSRYLGVQL